MLPARPSHAPHRMTTRLGLAAMLAVVALPAVSRADGMGFDPAATYKVALGDGPRRGSPDAPITIVEWSDFSCGYCYRVRATLAQLERLYPGQLRLVFRHMPLDDEETLAAEASLAAAAQGRFWPMHDRLFAVRGRVDRAAVDLLASEVGLDLGRFRADLDSGAYRRRVAVDAEAARALGIRGTPSFFVNGRAIRGNQPLQVFVRTVDEELVRARAALATGVTADRLYDHLIASGAARADAPEDAAPRYDELDEQTSYRVGLGLPGHSQGPADALVTVVEWSDFECPYCARNAPVLARLRREYGDRVRLVFRHMPLPMHARAPLAAEATVAAAAQGKFWAMHDRIFAEPARLSRADFEEHARAIGLDMAQFRAALDERRYREAVAADEAAGSILGVEGTPTLFINGSAVPGAPRWEHLKQLVDARLAEAQQLMAAGVARGDVYGLLMLRAQRAERGDPSRMPTPATTGSIELGQDDREVAVEAACRGRDAARARSLAARLARPHRAAAAGTCAAFGIDIE
jgi:protein-disulfide isomerase